MSTELKELAVQHLSKVNIMQLATAENNNPWICTVHFYADDDLKIYWVSRTDRQHSQQIANNPLVSATSVVHVNNPQEDYAIAVTIAGQAEIVTEVPVTIRAAYQAKLEKPDNMLPSDDPNNLQEFYCLTPDKLVLFDTKNLKGNPRQEITL